MQFSADEIFFLFFFGEKREFNERHGRKLKDQAKSCPKGEP